MRLIWITLSLTTTLVFAQLSPPTGCNVDVGCFNQCTGNTCRFAVTWRDNGDMIDFTLQLSLDTLSGNQWIGLGLSDDQSMGSDSVTYCRMGSNSVIVGKAYNPGRTQPTLITPSQEGLSAITGSTDNNVLTCTYSQTKTSTNANIFDLTQTWYLLVAYGSTSGENLSKHSASPLVSSDRTSLTSVQSVSGSAVNIMIKVHGCLMLFAWVFCASIGIVFARFYKPMWPNTKLCGDDKLWFVCHRVLMILALAACVASFIIIFVEIGEWSKLLGHTTVQRAHPYLGVLVTALCVINPIMALFRPHPGDVSRPLFNWAHWGVGTTAHILAALTLILGVTLTSSIVPFYVVWVLLAWVAYQITIITFLEVYDCCIAGDKKRYYQNGAEKPPKGSLAKTSFLILHMFIISCFTLATIVIVALTTEEDMM